MAHKKGEDCVPDLQRQRKGGAIPYGERVCPLCRDFAAILVKRGDYETTAYHIPSGADARTASTSGDPKSAGAAAIFFRVTNRPQPVWGPKTTKPA